MLDEYEEFKKNFLLLSGLDLNCYKETQMKRRILSFMGRHQCENLQAFFQLILIIFLNQYIVSVINYFILIMNYL